MTELRRTNHISQSSLTTIITRKWQNYDDIYSCNSICNFTFCDRIATKNFGQNCGCPSRSLDMKLQDKNFKCFVVKFRVKKMTQKIAIENFIATCSLRKWRQSLWPKFSSLIGCKNFQIKKLGTEFCHQWDTNHLEIFY